jgi:formyltetrahydrofolate-dependent phosphoribosylglycinamide formyltransferase
MSRLRVGVLASGSGTTFQNLVERSRDGRLRAEIVVLAVSKAEAFAKVRAESLGVPCAVLPKEIQKDPERLGVEIARVLDAHGAELCAMAGFLKLWTIPEHWRGRVLNVHPALLPAFGGHNMYGHFVHESVVASGAKVSGCTVHFADDEYDQGPIVLQRAVPVTFEDTPATLAARVQEAEREAYPEAIQLAAEGRLRIEGRRVRILPPSPPASA